MQLPIVPRAPLVAAHAVPFRDLFENCKQYRHFQYYLRGLIVLPNKSMTDIPRCVVDSADKSNLSWFFSGAPWFQESVNHRRIWYLLQETGTYAVLATNWGGLECKTDHRYIPAALPD